MDDRMRSLLESHGLPCNVEPMMRSRHDPSIDVMEAARKAYPTCETCYKGYIHAWYVPYKYMEALQMVAEYHKTNCPKKTTHKGNGVYQGAFAFTLNKSPKDPQSVGDMLAAVKKIMGQKSCKVKKYAWYYEDKGQDEWGAPEHPHIHGMYETETGGKIETKHWKRAWPLWDPAIAMGSGFKGGYHRQIRSDEKYSNYIKKDGGMCGQSDSI